MKRDKKFKCHAHMMMVHLNTRLIVDDVDSGDRPLIRLLLLC